MWAGFYADGASAAMRVMLHVVKSWEVIRWRHCYDSALG